MIYTTLHLCVCKAEDVIMDWQREGIQPDVVMVDPPRKGVRRNLFKHCLI